jgi:proliferating cell nuclear antigen
MDIKINNHNKAELFASIFQNIKIFTEHISILCKPNGLYVQTMDSSRVSIIELTLPSTWFDLYSCEKDVVIGISSNILYKILNAREKSQHIQIIYETDSNDSLSIHFTSEEKNNFDKHFEVPLIDLEVEHMAIPTIDYVAEFIVPSGIFSALITQLKMFGETMDIKCNENNIILFSNSPDSGKMSVEMNIDDLTSFAINEGEELNMSFSLNYLHHICSFNKLSKEIEIKLCNQYPLSIIYDLGGEGFMKFFLAPKIDDSSE